MNTTRRGDDLHEAIDKLDLDPSWLSGYLLAALRDIANGETLSKTARGYALFHLEKLSEFPRHYMRAGHLVPDDAAVEARARLGHLSDPAPLSPEQVAELEDRDARYADDDGTEPDPAWGSLPGESIGFHVERWSDGEPVDQAEHDAVSRQAADERYDWAHEDGAPV